MTILLKIPLEQNKRYLIRFSSPTDHFKIPEKSFASLNMRSSVAELEKLTDKALAISQRRQFSITRANLRRVGNATLVAPPDF